MWVHHTHDASLWPMQGIGMKNNVEKEYGKEEAHKRFRLRWTENAEHVPPDGRCRRTGPGQHHLAGQLPAE